MTSSAPGPGRGRRWDDGPGAPAPSAVSWHSVLASLEDDVSHVEQRLADREFDQAPGGQGSWVPPADMGSIPIELRQRALELLQRQLAAAETLVEQITRSKRQREVTQRMSPRQGRPPAIYVDEAL